MEGIQLIELKPECRQRAVGMSCDGREIWMEHYTPDYRLRTEVEYMLNKFLTFQVFSMIFPQMGTGTLLHMTTSKQAGYCAIKADSDVELASFSVKRLYGRNTWS